MEGFDSFPCGEPASVDRLELVEVVPGAILDAFHGIPDGADKGDQEGRQGCLGWVTEAKTTFRHRKEGQVLRKKGEGGL